MSQTAKRYNTLVCGRRWGKSLFLVRRAGMRALRGESYGYFAPTYKILTEVFEDLARRLAPCARVLRAERRIQTANGGLIEFWTLEDENAGRSRRYHEVGIDEAGLVANLEAKWFESIRPTLTDFKGKAWFAGTPKGRNFFWTAYSLGQDSHEADWASWQMPTATNPYIDPSEIDEAQRGMPERSFRQEYLAEFLEEAGGVFRGVRAVVANGVISRTGDGPFVIGVDLARIEDFTVITVVDRNGRQVEFERFNQISWERQIAAIRRFMERYPDATVILDSTGVGDPIYEQLRISGRVEGFKFTSASKEALIDNLAMLIEQSAVSLLDIPEQTNELLAYQYELTPSRNVRMNAPAGMHDDTVIALALAVWPLRPVRRASYEDALQLLTP